MSDVIRGDEARCVTVQRFILSLLVSDASVAASALFSCSNTVAFVQTTSSLPINGYMPSVAVRHSAIGPVSVSVSPDKKV